MEVGSGKERIVEEKEEESPVESEEERERERRRERLGKAPSIRGTNKISGQEHFQRFMARLHQVKQAQRRKEARGERRKSGRKTQGKWIEEQRDGGGRSEKIHFFWGCLSHVAVGPLFLLVVLPVHAFGSPVQCIIRKPAARTQFLLAPCT